MYDLCVYASLGDGCCKIIVYSLMKFKKVNVLVELHNFVNSIRVDKLDVFLV